MWDMFLLSGLMAWRRKFRGWLVLMLIGIGAVGCGEKLVDAPPPKVAVENSLFRILDVNVPPGTALRQSFQNGVALVVMTDGARMRTMDAGKDWGEEAARGVGNVTIAEAGEHGVRNVGDGALQLLALENLRRNGASTAPLAAKGMTVVGESASLRAYDAKLAEGNLQV